MSSPAQQPELQGTPPEKPSKVGPQKAYAFIYAPGPQWLAGRHGEGVRAAYVENTTIHEAASLPYGGDYHGLEGALRHGQGFRAAWDRYQPHEARGLDPQIVADADHVVVLRRHQVENAETGDRLDLPAVSAYRMENAKIENSRMFHSDTAALPRFLERNVARPASHLPRGVR